MALEITQEFDQPYSQRTQALPSTTSPSVVALNGVSYLINTSDDTWGNGRYKREMFQVVQQRNVTDQRDVLLLPQEVWRQQTQSWHLGAGQTNLDRDSALPARFNDSFGVDPWTQWRLSLLPSTTKLTSPTLSGETWLTNYNGTLAVINGQAIYWYSNIASGPSGSTVVHSGDAIVDVADSGQIVTTLHASGRVYTTEGPTGTPAYARTYTGANFIQWCKDFLIVGQTNKLSDATVSGAGTLVYTHPIASFRWVDACAGNSCIYVLGGAADNYVVHRINIKSDGTGLSPAIVAATLPDGEIGYSIQSYLGFVFIGTNKGIRVAQEANTSGDLTLGPLIPTPAPVYCFEGQDRFVWYGNNAMDGSYATNTVDSSLFPTSPVCGLGRMDLSVSTVSALSPAYANDIWASNVSGHIVHSVMTFNGKRVFSVNDVGVYYEADTLVSAGWLEQGTVSYSVEDPKTGLYVQAKYLPLVGSIGVDVSYDNTSYVRLVNLEIEDSIRSGNVSLDGAQFSRADFRYLLKQGTSTDGPTLTRFELRSIPVKGRSSKWTIPIMNYEQVEIDGVPVQRNPLAVLENLMDLVETSAVFIYQESGKSYTVHVADFQWTPEKLTMDGKCWQGIFTIIIQEVQ